MKKKIGLFLILYWLSFGVNLYSFKNKNYLLTNLPEYISSKFRLFKTKKIGIDFPRFSVNKIEDGYSQFLYNYAPGIFDIMPAQYPNIKKFFQIEDSSLNKVASFLLNFSPPRTNIIKLAFYLLYFMYEDNFYYNYFYFYREKYALKYKKLLKKKFLQPISCLETNMIMGKLLQKTGFNLEFLILPPLYYFNRKLPEAHAILLIQLDTQELKNIKRKFLIKKEKKYYLPLDATLFLKGKDRFSPFISLSIAVKRAFSVYNFVRKNGLSIYIIKLKSQKTKYNKKYPLELKPFINYILNSRKVVYEKEN